MFAAHVIHITEIPLWTLFIFAAALVLAAALTVRWVMGPPGEQ